MGASRHGNAAAALETGRDCLLIFAVSPLQSNCSASLSAMQLSAGAQGSVAARVKQQWEVVGKIGGALHNSLTALLSNLERPPLYEDLTEKDTFEAFSARMRLNSIRSQSESVRRQYLVLTDHIAHLCAFLDSQAGSRPRDSSSPPSSIDPRDRDSPSSRSPPLPSLSSSPLIFQPSCYSDMSSVDGDELLSEEAPLLDVDVREISSPEALLDPVMGSFEALNLSDSGSARDSSSDAGLSPRLSPSRSLSETRGSPLRRMQTGLSEPMPQEPAPGPVQIVPRRRFDANASDDLRKLLLQHLTLHRLEIEQEAQLQEPPPDATWHTPGPLPSHPSNEEASTAESSSVAELQIPSPESTSSRDPTLKEPTLDSGLHGVVEPQVPSVDTAKERQAWTPYSREHHWREVQEKLKELERAQGEGLGLETATKLSSPLGVRLTGSEWALERTTEPLDSVATDSAGGPPPMAVSRLGTEFKPASFTPAVFQFGMGFKPTGTTRDAPLGKEAVATWGRHTHSLGGSQESDKSGLKGLALEPSGTQDSVPVQRPSSASATVQQPESDGVSVQERENDRCLEASEPRSSSSVNMSSSIDMGRYSSIGIDPNADDRSSMYTSTTSIDSTIDMSQFTSSSGGSTRTSRERDSTFGGRDSLEDTGTSSGKHTTDNIRNNTKENIGSFGPSSLTGPYGPEQEQEAGEEQEQEMQLQIVTGSSSFPAEPSRAHPFLQDPGQCSACTTLPFLLLSSSQFSFTAL